MKFSIQIQVAILLPTFMSEFVELLPCVFFSSRTKAEEETARLSETKVSHILYLGKRPKWLRHILPKISKVYFNTPKDPVIKKKWISKFSDTNCILIESIAQGGVWIIGKASIAKLVVSAYLISSKGLSITESISHTPQIASITINECIYLQLKLWKAMEGRIDETFAPYIHYKNEPSLLSVKNTSEARFQPDIVQECLTRIATARDQYKNGKLDLWQLETLGERNWGYCCTVCKARLVRSCNIAMHNNTTQFQPILNEEYPCDAIAVEPLLWMGDINRESGDLQCYSCGIKVGDFNWEQSSCPTCNEDLPSNFLLYIKSICFVSPKTPTRCNTKSRSSSFRRMFTGGEKKPAVLSPSIQMKKEYTVVVATRFQELPKEAQKQLARARITEELANDNWYIVTKILLFTSHLRVRVCDCNNFTSIESITKFLVPKAKEQDDTSKDVRRAHSVFRGMVEMTRGTEFEAKMGVTDEDEILAQFHSLIMNYVRYVYPEWKSCDLPLLNMNIPNYVDLVTVTFLSAEDPQKLFKINNNSPAGKGGYGTVFNVKDIESGKDKIKKLAVKKMVHSDPERMAANYKEIAIMASCSHENIVKYMGCYRLEDELWIVMELLEGGTLDELQEFCGSISETQFAFIARECLKGLKYLHDLGLCHRDIKPGNIMFSNNYGVKFIDFGLCDTTQQIAESPKMVGSPTWMPPEMIFHVPQTVKADVWSLGCSLLQVIDPKGFELGSRASTLFTVAREGRENFVPTPGTKHSSKLLDFLRCMLTYKPEDRATVDELLAHKFITSKTFTGDELRVPIEQLITTRNVFK